MRARYFLSGFFLTATLLANAQTNDTDASGDEIPFISVHSTHTPTTANNYIPNSNGKISADIEIDDEDRYTAIVVKMDFSLITATEPSRDQPTDGTLCNNEGQCVGGFHAYIELPEYDRFPYRTLQINWNPYGHFPMAFGVNHMDYHFHSQSLEELRAIEVGSCGAEHVTCDPEIKKKLTTPLAARHLPKGYSNAALDSSVANMGSHLIDFSTAPGSSAEFDQIFIYGAYDGRLSFDEPMITKTYFEDLKRRTLADSSIKDCFDTAQPEVYPDNNFHPQQWCAQYIKVDDDIRVSMEKFTDSRSRVEQPNSGSQALTAIIWSTVAAFFASILGAFL